MKEKVLILLAHHDDEYFVTGRICREIAEGREVHVVFTTYGSAYGTPAEVRQKETQAMLGSLGIPARQIHLAGVAANVFDGTAHRNLEGLFETVLSLTQGISFQKIYTMAWEGGHTDHDATHLIAAALVRQWNVENEFYEFPAYNSYGVPKGMFRIATLTPGAEASRVRLGGFERLRLFFLFRYYPSQWKTFIALLPETFCRVVLLGEQLFRRANAHSYRERPHDGVLFYERRFGCTFEDFALASREFVRDRIG